MNSAFVGNEKENLQNLVDALIGELGETVFKSGTLRATFYEDETPRFTRGKYFLCVLTLRYVIKLLKFDGDNY